MISGENEVCLSPFVSMSELVADLRFGFDKLQVKTQATLNTNFQKKYLAWCYYLALKRWRYYYQATQRKPIIK